MLAVAAANASVLPLGYPYAYAYAPQISLAQGLSPYGLSPYGYGLSAYASPLAYGAQTIVAGPGQVVAAHAAPAVVAAPAPAVVAAQAVVPAAQYVAQTRGSTHVAPLIGHVQSVSSQNVQPAPGTL